MKTRIQISIERPRMQLVGTSCGSYLSEISVLVPTSYETDLGTAKTLMREASPLKQLSKCPCWPDEKFQSGNAIFDTLFEQRLAVWTGQRRGERVLLSFFAKPNDKPVEIDLAAYLQLALTRRASLSRRNLRTGPHPIRLVGERFHNLPPLKLHDAWRRWQTVGP